MNRATNEDSRIKLKKEYTFLPILRLDKWILDGRLLCENLSPKQALQGTKELHWTFLEIDTELLHIFDQRNWKYHLRICPYIKSCQICIKQLSGCVILSLGYHLNNSRMKWYRRGVYPNPILFYRKINFPLLIFQRRTA